MGSFDPILGEDDENQGGNILNAMVNFPAKYAFHVVAKTDGDEEIISKYVEDVKAILQNSIIPSEENTIEVEVIPRGSKYTKVKVEAIVESHKVCLWMNKLNRSFYSLFSHTFVLNINKSIEQTYN